MHVCRYLVYLAVWLSVYQSYMSVCDICSLSIDVAGLLVGRLKGSMVRATGPLGLVLRSDEVVVADTIIGDKSAAYHDRDGWPIHDTLHEIVLRSSTQCLPMVKFDKALQDHKEGRQCVQHLQDSLQQIIDRLFNEGMVSSDIHDAPIITTPVCPFRATLSSASWVPPRAAPAFVYM